MEFPRKLSSTQQADLEIDVSNEKIKMAVSDYRIDKSPGPNGFTFGFYRHFWKLIEKDEVDAVKYFFKHGALPKGSMFKGVELGRSMQLSHIFYADDVIFVGQWNDSNIDTLVHVLDCF
nr:RNA-directed DNA polymerase, eukaryota, reverse transcriptase zinc-binding domain protein [Tanacetum cinerariifolium]